MTLPSVTNDLLMWLPVWLECLIVKKFWSSKTKAPTFHKTLSLCVSGISALTASKVDKIDFGHRLVRIICHVGRFREHYGEDGVRSTTRVIHLQSNWINPLAIFETDNWVTYTGSSGGSISIALLHELENVLIRASHVPWELLHVGTFLGVFANSQWSAEVAIDVLITVQQVSNLLIVNFQVAYFCKLSL